MQPITELSERDLAELYSFFHLFVDGAYYNEQMNKEYCEAREKEVSQIFDPKSFFFCEAEELTATEEHFKSRGVFAAGIWFAMREWMKSHGFEMTPEAVRDYYGRDSAT